MTRLSPPSVAAQCEARFQNGDSRHQILNEDGVFKRQAPSMRQALILADEDDMIVSRQKPKGHSTYQWVIVSRKKSAPHSKMSPSKMANVLACAAAKTTANPNGQLIEAGAMILRQTVGTATLGKVKYELTTTMAGAPLVKNCTTGLTFAFSWEDLVDQARAAGIDEVR